MRFKGSEASQLTLSLAARNWQRWDSNFDPPNQCPHAAFRERYDDLEERSLRPGPRTGLCRGREQAGRLQKGWQEAAAVQGPLPAAVTPAGRAGKGRPSCSRRCRVSDARGRSRGPKFSKFWMYRAHAFIEHLVKEAD